MPIYAPGKRINPTLARRTGTGKKSVYAGLFLTSMVDMFAIMVIFLLQSFSSEGELIVLPPGLELPKAKNVGTLERAPSLVIGKDIIMFEGVEIAKTPDVDRQEEWAIPALQEALKAYKVKMAADAAKLSPEMQALNQKPEQKINISADKSLLFGTVKKVIYNAGFIGFPDFRFAVFAGATAETHTP